MRECKHRKLCWFDGIALAALAGALVMVVVGNELKAIRTRLAALESRAAWFRPEAVKETTDGK